MAEYKSEFMRVMRERGFIHQCTDESGLDAKLADGKTAGYIGFDCTASSLHIGSLIQIMVLRWLQKTGHKPIILLGGATTKIGDPSGKDESRPPLSDEVIEKNKAGIRRNFSQFGLGDCTFVDNAEWISKLSAIDLLETAENFSVNRMLKFDSVQIRLEREHHLSLKEFLYLAIQAYDFVELKKRYDCSLQIGGSDQWGNIVSGVELNRKIQPEYNPSDENLEKEYEKSKPYKTKHELYGLTTPLITTTDGGKMGKTATGAVWLNPEMLSPYDYWQFWRNTDDKDVERFVKLFTELELDKIKEIMAGNINEAKKILATEATTLCRGKDEALKAQESAKKTFEEGQLGESLPVLNIREALQKAGSINTSSLVHMAFGVSMSEARRLIVGKGIKINDKTVENDVQHTLEDFNDGPKKLSSGKKKHRIVKV